MNAEVQPASRQIVKKITAKVVMGGKPSIEKLIRYMDQHGKDAVMPLFGIVGRCSDFTAGQSDFGPYVKLLGQFKAVNQETGEQFRSGAAILPGSANDLVYGALRGLGEGGGAIEFAFRVGLKRDESVAIGYVYVVEQVYNKAQDDALDDLERRLAGLPPPATVSQLPPPAAAAASGTGSKKR